MSFYIREVKNITKQIDNLKLYGNLGNLSKETIHDGCMDLAYTNTTLDCYLVRSQC